MKIVLVREKGNSTIIQMRRRTVYAVLALGTFAVALAAVLGARALNLNPVDEQVIAAWQQRLSDQDELVAKLRSRTEAENAAVGRQLAQMQARLWRMEALGARVSEVADLEGAGFSFDAPAPQGGPVSGDSVAFERTDLESHITQLAGQIRERETELEILESLLLDDQYQRSAAPRGRPVTWGWMSSPYGRRIDPISGRSAWHAGVDFAGKEGADVIAVASGVVTFSGEKSGYGNVLEITHADGYSSRYGHSKELLVEVGDIVHKGQRIATIGSTGRSTGPHVHFEVRKHGRHVDPARYVSRM